MRIENKFIKSKIKPLKSAVVWFFGCMLPVVRCLLSAVRTATIQKCEFCQRKVKIFRSFFLTLHHDRKTYCSGGY
jgi:hypothetical protein